MKMIDVELLQKGIKRLQSVFDGSLISTVINTCLLQTSSRVHILSLLYDACSLKGVLLRPNYLLHSSTAISGIKV